MQRIRKIKEGRRNDLRSKIRSNERIKKRLNHIWISDIRNVLNWIKTDEQ